MIYLDSHTRRGQSSRRTGSGPKAVPAVRFFEVLFTSHVVSRSTGNVSLATRASVVVDRGKASLESWVLLCAIGPIPPLGGVDIAGDSNNSRVKGGETSFDWKIDVIPIEDCEGGVEAPS